MLQSELQQPAPDVERSDNVFVVPTGHARHTVWIDLENSPHVPFFLPIIKELEARGCKVVVTARDCFQVCELAELAGLKYRTIGHHYGKNPIAKLTGLGIRVLQLASPILKERPEICVSHGSRSSIILSALLGIPSINIVDYEFADQRLTSLFGSRQKKWILTPAIVPSESFQKSGTLPDHILHYPGIKEDVYVPFFRPDSAWTRTLGVAPEDTIVTLRPPATEAHYHNPESEELLTEVFNRLERQPEIKTILLPRTPKQEAEIRKAKPDLFASGRIIVPKFALNGLDLIWRSDVVISGGGTMNREAAALGVPVYSFFRGTLGAIDKHLSDTGKLVLLQSKRDVTQKLKLVRRQRTAASESGIAASLDAVVNHVVSVVERRA
jgi:predicted glycosyltransferase